VLPPYHFLLSSTFPSLLAWCLLKSRLLVSLLVPSLLALDGDFEAEMTVFFYLWIIVVCLLMMVRFLCLWRGRCLSLPWSCDELPSWLCRCRGAVAELPGWLCHGPSHLVDSGWCCCVRVWWWVWLA